MKSSAGRPREFDPDVFLNTALNCFWQNGYQATSMADLMKASGLASASIYKLYPDKRAIYLAALQRYMDEGTLRTKKEPQKCRQKPPCERRLNLLLSYHLRLPERKVVLQLPQPVSFCLVTKRLKPKFLQNLKT